MHRLKIEVRAPTVAYWNIHSANNSPSTKWVLLSNKAGDHGLYFHTEDTNGVVGTYVAKDEVISSATSVAGEEHTTMFDNRSKHADRFLLLIQLELYCNDNRSPAV